MKKIYFSTMIACLLAFVGCQNEELVNETTDTGNGKKVTLTATIAGATDSRVALNEISSDGELNVGAPVINVNWRNDSNNPEIFKVHGSQSQWTEFTQTQGNNFAGVLPEGADYAYYGYTVSDNTISYDLSGQDGTLNENYILMQAPVTDSSSKITFEHKTAILKVKFNGVNNQTVTKIVMDNVHTGSNNESITVTPTQASLGYFYIFLPIENEGSYGVGHTFNFTVTASDTEYTGSLTIPENMSIVAGKLYTAKLSIIIPYVTFSAESVQTLELKQIITEEYDDNTDKYVSVHKPYPGSGDDDGVIEYLVGDQGWLQFTPNTGSVTFGGEKGDLRLRGISPNGTLQAQIVFDEDNTTPVDCSGDIRTLVDWKHHKTAGTSNAIFQGLFQGCSVLTSAPELPATTLAPYCYKSMFYYCTSLTEAPELPATTLANQCYGQMFAGCTSLKAAPELPATTLANNCYNGMFVSCTSLRSAPALRATSLKPGCYNGMFNSCTSLKSAPELPATTLVDNCYAGMFAGCSELTSAPALRATTLKPGCYYQMFINCTKLNSITMLATNIIAGCLTFWVDGVANSGTFTQAADVVIPTGAHGIPEGWGIIYVE